MVESVYSPLSVCRDVRFHNGWSITKRNMRCYFPTLGSLCIRFRFHFHFRNSLDIENVVYSGIYVSDLDRLNN